MSSSVPAWKARFGFQCISAVIQSAQTAKVPNHNTILELDRKVRDMELPKYAEQPPKQGAGLGEAMKHFMPRNYRHLSKPRSPSLLSKQLLSVLALLYIHRCFFAEAVSSNPTNPMKSPYAPSFLAGYRSACELIGGLRTQFDLFPAQIARFWVLWTHAFSSSVSAASFTCLSRHHADTLHTQVMLSSVVTHASGSGARSKITAASLTELRRAVDLFREASAFGGRAEKFLVSICNGIPDSE